MLLSGVPGFAAAEDTAGDILWEQGFVPRQWGIWLPGAKWAVSATLHAMPGFRPGDRVTFTERSVLRDLRGRSQGEEQRGELTRICCLSIAQLTLWLSPSVCNMIILFHLFSAWQSSNKISLHCPQYPVSAGDQRCHLCPCPTFFLYSSSVYPGWSIGFEVDFIGRLREIPTHQRNP